MSTSTAPADTTIPTAQPRPDGGEDFVAIDAWWRACNYLTVGQIYLKDNPLLGRPLTGEDI